MTEPDDVTASRAWEPGLRSIREPGVPLFMNVTLTINPERLDQFLAALRDVLPAARAEPTCIYLHAGQSVTESNVFILSEGWRDLVEYRDVILHKPYFQAYLQISESTYAKPRVTQPLIPGPDGFLTNALPGAHRIHREMVTSAHPGESEHQ